MSCKYGKREYFPGGELHHYWGWNRAKIDLEIEAKMIAWHLFNIDGKYCPSWQVETIKTIQ